MSKGSIFLALVTAALGFAAGFFLANSFNRSELDNLRVEAEKYKTTAANTEKAKTEMTLSDEEIKEKIAQADANPEYLAFQRDLGSALYSYASMKQEPKLLHDAARLLERAVKLAPTDTNLKITLGNVYLNIGYAEKNSESLSKARVLYETVLKSDPSNAGILTDIGSTYLYDSPSDPDKAMTFIKRSLDLNPNDERTLYFAVQTAWKAGKTDEAGNYLQQLRSFHPSSRSINELTTMMTQSPTAK